MTTRSGRKYAVDQSACRASGIEAVAEVLCPYLALRHILEARSVCRAWSKAWGRHVPCITLNQPPTATAARRLGRRAAAAFPGIRVARVSLYHTGLEGVLDLTSANGDVRELPTAAERPEAARALLQQLQQLGGLRRLHFSVFPFATSSILPQVIPELSTWQLRVLDLTEVSKGSSILRVISAHLTQLHELVLDRVEPWCPDDVASLDAVPTFQKLSCCFKPSLPAVQGTAGFGALHRLKSLQVRLQLTRAVDGLAATPSAAQQAALEATIIQFAGMTSMQELSVHISSGHIARMPPVQGDPGMPDAHYSSSSSSSSYDASTAWVKALAGMRWLRFLLLQNFTVDDAFLLAAAQQHLKSLVLVFSAGHGPNCITAAGASAAARLQHIHIQAPATALVSGCWEPIKTLPNVVLQGYGFGSTT